MKLTLAFLALTASGISSVLGVPATIQTSNVTTLPAPHGFTPFDVSESVDAAPARLPTAEKGAVIDASAQYWVCVAVSTSTGRYGWSRGGSEYSALQNAKRECGRGDCTFYSCIDEGCVGIDYGWTDVALSYARGYGRNDGSEAASIALSKCRAKSGGCGRPGYFCAAWIY